MLNLLLKEFDVGRGRIASAQRLWLVLEDLFDWSPGDKIFRLVDFVLISHGAVSDLLGPQTVNLAVKSTALGSNLMLHTLDDLPAAEEGLRDGVIFAVFEILSSTFRTHFIVLIFIGPAGAALLRNRLTLQLS